MEEMSYTNLTILLLELLHHTCCISPPLVHNETWIHAKGKNLLPLLSSCKLNITMTLNPSFFPFLLVPNCIFSLSRSSRESTPCSLIRDADTIGTTTPGSSTRPTSLSTRRIRPRNIPTAHELEEFFTHAEREEQRLFTEKYTSSVYF